MGYATKRVKVRRANYHRLLRAQVGLAGYEFYSFATENLRTGKPGVHVEARRAGKFLPRYFNTNENLIAVVRECARELGLED